MIFCLKCDIRSTLLAQSVVMTVLIILFASCNTLNLKKTSYWASQKGNFKYTDLTVFVSDSNLRQDIKKCYKVKHKSIDSVVSPDGVYLYSWQNRDTLTNEFTVIEDEGERGLDIIYVIMDKNDNLLSVTELAGKGLESNIIYEIRSRFISRDSIVQIQSITQTWDMEKRKEMDKFAGDSTFVNLIIGKGGKISEKIFKQVTDLNYKNP
jgi:hypothetical protein